MRVWRFLVLAYHLPLDFESREYICIRERNASIKIQILDAGNEKASTSQDTIEKSTNEGILHLSSFFPAFKLLSSSFRR